MPTKTDLRRFNPTSRQVQTQSPRATPEAFGAGVGLALGNIAQSLTNKALLSEDTVAAKEALARAHADRQRKIERSQYQIRFIQLKSKLQLDLAEMQRNAPPGGLNLTEDMSEWARASFLEFKQTLPEYLQNEFNPLIEQVYSETATLGYTAQVSAESSAFLLSVADIVQKAANEIHETLGEPRILFQELAAGVRKLYTDSPLDSDTAESEYKLALLILKKSLYIRETRDENLYNRGEGTVPGKIVKMADGRVTTTGGPVLPGLSPEVDGFLTALMGPESDGTYNALYGSTSSNPKTFTDFSWHPNQVFIAKDGTKITAAGAYGFIYETWVRIAAELGLTDFSPESQDKAAWHLAETDYFKKTGLSLRAALRSGDRKTFSDLKHTLTTTWEGLLPENLSDGDFFNTIAAATGTPSNLMFDEIYDDIPSMVKQQLSADGMAESNKISLQIQFDISQAKDRRLEEFYKALARQEPGATFEAAANLAGELNLTQNERNALGEAVAKRFATELAIERAIARINGGTTNPSDADHKGDLDKLALSRNIVGAIQNEDPAAAAIIAKQFGKAGYIPGNLVNQLRNKIYSQDSKSVFFAYDMMKLLQDENEIAFESAFGVDIAGTTAAFNLLRGMYPDEEVMDRLRALTSPEGVERRKVQRASLDAHRLTSPDKHSLSGIMKAMGFNAQIYDQNTATALWNEFTILVESYYFLTDNYDESVTMAKKNLLRRWGEITLDGFPVTMKYPPQMFNEPFQEAGVDRNKGYDYMWRQLFAQVVVPSDSTLSLVSDGTTYKQVKDGDNVSYAVIIIDSIGGPRPVLISDTVSYQSPGHIRGKVLTELRRETADNQFRWRPEITAEMQKAADLVIFEQHAAHIRREVIAEAIKTETDPRIIRLLEEEDKKILMTVFGLDPAPDAADKPPALRMWQESGPYYSGTSPDSQQTVLSMTPASDTLRRLDALQPDRVYPHSPPSRDPTDNGSFETSPTLGIAVQRLPDYLLQLGSADDPEDDGSFSTASTAGEAIRRLGPAGDPEDDDSFRTASSLKEALIRLARLAKNVLALPSTNATIVTFKKAVLDRRIPWSVNELTYMKLKIVDSDSTSAEVLSMLTILAEIQERLIEAETQKRLIDGN